MSILHCASGGGQLSINGLCYGFVGCTKDCSGNGLTVSKVDAQTIRINLLEALFEYMEVSKPYICCVSSKLTGFQ